MMEREENQQIEEINMQCFDRLWSSKMFFLGQRRAEILQETK